MKTQLEPIKDQARMLLYTDIHLTEFSPMVIQHPFTTSGFVGIKEDGSVRILNIAENEDDLYIWREYICDLIEKSETAYDLYMLFAAPYALTFLKYAKPYLSEQDLSKILASAWMESENPNQDPNVPKYELITMFQQADPQILMSSNDYDIYRSLPEIITVYRGVKNETPNSCRGLSWSLDREIAEWFAKRFDDHGYVYEGKINKKYVYAYFSNRDESEVIVHPKYLSGLTKYIINI